MGDVGTDSLQNLITRWNISFDCPSCCHKIEVSDMTACTNRNHANIVGWVHRTCMCENPKKSHVCMGCGSMSSHRPSKVKCKDNCKYMGDGENFVDGGSNNSALDNLAETREELAPSCDNLIESGAADDSALGGDPFLFVEHDNDSDILGSPNREHDREHVINTHFDNGNEWPNPSKRFFTRETIRKGDGLRGLVYNALIDSKRMTDFSGLSEEEMHYHLHITSINHGLLQTKSRDVCAMTHHVLRIEQQQRTELEKLMKKA